MEVQNKPQTKSKLDHINHLDMRSNSNQNEIFDERRKHSLYISKDQTEIMNTTVGSFTN